MPKPMPERFVLACMVGQPPFSSASPSPPGEYAVRAPRHTDPIAGSLRLAYGVQKLPREWVQALEKLDRY